MLLFASIGLSDVLVLFDDVLLEGREVALDLGKVLVTMKVILAREVHKLAVAWDIL